MGAAMLCVMRLHITMTSTMAAVPRSPMASEVPTSTLNESLTKACATCSAVFTTSVDRLTVTSFCARYSFEYRSMARSMSPASAAPITALRRAPNSSQAFEKRSRRSGSALNSDRTTFSSFMRCSVRSSMATSAFCFAASFSASSSCSTYVDIYSIVKRSATALFETMYGRL